MTITVTITGDVPTILSEMRGFLEATAPGAPPEAGAETPRPRGRPRKAAEMPAGAPESAQDEPAPAALPTPAPKPAAKPAPSQEALQNDSVDKATVQKALIEVVKRLGRDACGDLCRKHGGPNLSALAEDTYPAVLADAQAMLAAIG